MSIYSSSGAIKCRPALKDSIMRRRNAGLSLIAAAAFTLCAGIQTTSVAAEPGPKSASESTVSITLGRGDVTTVLNVPSLYARGQTTEQVALARFMKIYATLPDFSPLPERGFFSDPKQDLQEKDKLISIDISQGNGFGMDILEKNSIKSGSWKKSSHTSQVPGMDLYEEGLLDWGSANELGTLIYIPSDSGMASQIFIVCHSHNKQGPDGKHFLCNASTQFTHGLYGQINFPYSEINHWREIRNDAIHLIESFVKP